MMASIYLMEGCPTIPLPFMAIFVLMTISLLVRLVMYSLTLFDRYNNNIE